MRTRIITGAAVAAALTMGVAACDDTGSTGLNDSDATLRVLLTDAPTDYIAAAWVDIGAIQLVPAEDEGEGILTLTDDGTDGMVNLLELQDSATTQLAELEIEPGYYSQIRMIVDSARVDLDEGYEFRDGSTSRTLFVPSGAQTGIKLNLHDDDGESGIFIAPGETILVLDFDVSRSFVAQGNPHTPAGIHGMIFKPTVRVSVQDVAGTISGTVSAEADSIDVEGLTVTAEPADDGLLEDYQTTTATATTDSAGEYTIHFVVPGDYAVTVDAGEGFVTDPASRDVSVGEDEDVTGIDFVVDEENGDDENGDDENGDDA